MVLFDMGLTRIFILVVVLSLHDVLSYPATYSTFSCPNIRSSNVHLVYNKICYEFVVSRKDYWDGARHDCNNRGGDLAVVKNWDVQFYLQSRLASLNVGNHGVWIGLNDRHREGHFVWVDGTPLDYSHWAVHEGNGALHLTQDCVQIQMGDHGLWHDRECHLWPNKFNYICQYPSVETIHTVTTTTTSTTTTPTRTTTTPTTTTTIPTTTTTTPTTTTTTPTTTTTTPTTTTTTPTTTRTTSSTTTTTPTTTMTTPTTTKPTTTTTLPNREYPKTTRLPDREYPATTPNPNREYPTSTPLLNREYPTSYPLPNREYPTSTPLPNREYPTSTPLPNREYPPTVTILSETTESFIEERVLSKEFPNSNQIDGTTNLNGHFLTPGPDKVGCSLKEFKCELNCIETGYVLDTDDCPLCKCN